MQHNTYTLWTHCPHSPPTQSQSASSTRCYNKTHTHNEHTAHIRDQHILNRHRQQHATTQHIHIMNTLPTFATNTFSIGIVNKMLQHKTYTLWTHCPRSRPTHSRSASSTRCYNKTHNEHTAHIRDQHILNRHRQQDATTQHIHKINTAQTRHQHNLNRHRQQDATTQYIHIMNTLPTFTSNWFSIGILKKMLQHNTYT